MRQSPAKTHQHLGNSMSAAFALADEAAEAISDAMQRAAGRAPAKVIAFKVRLSDEGVRKIRGGERSKYRLQSLVNFMLADKEVAAVVAHYAARFNEPSLFDHAAQRDFNRDLFRSARNV